MTYPRLLIAGTHSGVGKTTVTLALLAAFRSKGRRVQPFKVGPDFIDPGHHKAACGRESLNLDGWMLDSQINRQSFLCAAHDADLSIIEGMMGLFDGSSPVSDRGSAVEQAKQLDIPVLLVVDGSGMARSAAAMVYGYATFDPDLQVKGVLFNRIKSDGHYQLLKEAVEQDTDVTVVGYLSPDPEITIPDRHLGLQTAIEGKSDDLYKKLGQSVSETVDLGLIEQIAQSCSELSDDGLSKKIPASRNRTPSIKVGVAYDPAFCFYYRDNLDLLEAEGAELLMFSPINDTTLPEVDLLYLGGGYPEVYAQHLERNSAMRTAVKTFAKDGGVIYAECGGLMYLTSALTDFDGQSYDMAGVIPTSVKMSRRTMTLGYRSVECLESSILGEKGTTVRGHEFHYSSLVPQKGLSYAGALTDAQGRGRGQDGIKTGNVVALYTHVHFKSQPSIARSLVQAASMKVMD
ncbi:MAG: cobyrinate a,c-diamide synthase [Nitrospirales bacterium]